jgi:hypothetical protein
MDPRGGRLAQTPIDQEQPITDDFAIKTYFIGRLLRPQSV